MAGILYSAISYSSGRVGPGSPLGEVEQTEPREAGLSNAALAASVFRERVRTREARIGVIGLGYAGLPLALAFARQGFEVTGIDLNSDRVNAVNAGESYPGRRSGAPLWGGRGSSEGDGRLRGGG
jgi:hypothetical protein